MTQLTDIFTPALQTWLAAGAPQRSAISEEHEQRPAQNYVWPSAILDCPAKHAWERQRAPQTNPQPKSLALQHLLAQGTLAERKWLDVLSFSRLPVKASVPFESSVGISGELDMLLDTPTGEVPIEIKRTGLRLPLRYAWQAALYAEVWHSGACYLLLERPDGGAFEPLAMVYEPGVLGYVATDLRTGGAYTVSRERLIVDREELQARIALHLAAWEDPLEHRLPTPTTKQCVTHKKGSTICTPKCPYFCWETPAPTSIAVFEDDTATTIVALDQQAYVLEEGSW